VIYFYNTNDKTTYSKFNHGEVAAGLQNKFPKMGSHYLADSSWFPQLDPSCPGWDTLEMPTQDVAEKRARRAIEDQKDKLIELNCQDDSSVQLSGAVGSEDDNPAASCSFCLCFALKASMELAGR